MSGRKLTFDTVKALKLFREGCTYKIISKILGVKESTLKMYFKRNYPEELKRRKLSNNLKNKSLFEPHEDEFKLPVSGNLTVDDRMQLQNSRSFGLNMGEGMSNRNFVCWNRQAYKTDEDGNLHFDAEHSGNITKDLPRTYPDELLVVS